jgi:hypothetical protein
MTETTTSRAAEVAGYLKQWMFDPTTRTTLCAPSRASMAPPTATRT